ncbi:MAG: PIG-L family deacetylase, partial [Candidatus Dormibacteraeota bacterium]|nr:PIG-L family deacetylase [Candidatus Dormibacteraeota bacterium]
MSSGVTFGHAVVLVIHAHPDDEVFATGAATIAARSAGASVHLRLFTGGEVTRDGDL